MKILSSLLGMKLWKQVLIGLFLGVSAGVYLGQEAESLKIFGTIFINLIKMVIVPLIFFAILSGITSMDDEGNFTRVGVKGFGAYIFTAMFAVLIGLSAGLIFEPGAGVDLSIIPNENSEKVAAASQSAPPSIVEFLVALIPTNPIYSMANDGFLQIIIFTIFTGITINIVGERARPVKEVIHSAAQVSFKMIEIIIRLAPIGVFGFIAWVIGTQGTDILIALGKLIVTVLIACVFQYVILVLC